MRHLAKDQLLYLLKKLMNPKKYEMSEKESGEALIDFCGECPDPVKARWLIVECLDPMTDEELVDRALAMPYQSMNEVPFSVIPLGHSSRVGLH